MEIKTFSTPASFEGLNKLKDGSWSLRFYTQELSKEDLSVADDFHGGFGWLMFKENEFTIDDIPTDEANDETKSPSQRLRGVLYLYHKQQGGKPENFNRWYRAWIEKRIDEIKEKLI